MISPIVVGLLGGAVAARLMLRRRGLAGGGCARGFGGRRRFGRFVAPTVDTGRRAAERLAAQVKALELNTRQNEVLEETFDVIRDEAHVKTVAEWPALGRAFEAIAGDEFDPGLVKEQPEKIVDALEHLHDVLTPEQRATLN
jgi:hypothetical protein